jgi:polysaccharide chain length determinant protein (PEP-CTERM system associated)
MSSFHPLDYLSLVRRWRWWLATPLVVCVLAGVALAVLLPRVYRAQATIAVTAPRLSTDIVGQGSVALSREERIRAISQQLVSRPVIEQVVVAENLAQDRPVSAVVDELLAPQRIKVELTPLLRQAAAERAPIDAFHVSYSDQVPERAQRITNRLATVFVEVNSRSREERAEDTAAFISNQLGDSKRRLDALEERLRQAKEAYMGRLPEQTSANLSMLSGLRQQLESTANSLRSEQDRLSIIERQLEAMRQGSVTDDAVPRGVQLSAGQQRVLQLQQELATARTMYTERHPEIRRLQEDLAIARREAAEERNRPAEDRLAALQLDPTYRQLINDQQTSRLRIRDLQRSENQIRQQVAMYQSRVETAPMVEQQLASVQREYDLERQQYTALTARLQSAELAENLERGRAGEQFQVLHTAGLPRVPESPNVPRILLLAFGLGLGLGIAAVFGREFFDRTVHDIRGLQAEFDVPVLGEVSIIRRAA